MAHIKNAGFPSVESFIQHVIDNSNELYKAVTGQLLIVARGQNNHVMYIEFRPSKEEGQNYYRINSAFPVRNDNYADKHKFESLIKGREPLFTGPGDQYGYAALPENKANSGSPNATDENDNRNIPQTNTKSLSSIANIKSWLTTRQQKLMAEGKLKVIQSHSRNRAQGLYKDGVITLVADNLGSKDQVQQVLGHESWHFARDNDARVQTRLKVIDAQFQAVIERVKNGKGTAAEREAWRRVTQANTEKDLQVEEFQSYLLEAYAAKPQSLSEAVQKAVRDLVALIRATLFRYGFNLSSFSVADLAAIARGSLLVPGAVNATQNNGVNTLHNVAMPSVADMPDYEKQYQAIEAKYFNTDSSEKPGAMLAPNGKRSNLNKMQWIQVRTQAFKDWFGDWEAAQQEPAPLVEICGDEITGNTPKETRENAKQYIKELIDKLIKESGKDTIHNDRTGFDIRLTQKGVTHGFQHLGKEHVKAVAAIKQLIENAGKITTNAHKPEDKNIKSVHTLVAPLKLGSDFFAVKLTVKESWEGKLGLYDHQALEMTKPDGISESTLDKSSSIHRPASGFKVSMTDLLSAFKGKDTKYLASKVTDGNGEPLVVYHGTTSSFNEFKHGKASGSGDDDLYFGEGFYFTNDKEYADSYSGYDPEKTLGILLNIRSPFESTDPSHSSPWAGKSFMKDLRLSKNDEIQPYLIGQGHDGIIHESGEPNYGRSGLSDIDYNEYVIFEPNQAKSATANTGEFSPNNDDIRYSIADPLAEAKRKAGFGKKKNLPETIKAIVNQGFKTNAEAMKERWEEVKPLLEQGIFDRFLGIKRAEQEILGDFAYSKSSCIGA